MATKTEVTNQADGNLRDGGRSRRGGRGLGRGVRRGWRKVDFRGGLGWDGGRLSCRLRSRGIGSDCG